MKLFYYLRSNINTYDMTFHVHSADKMRDLEKFINDEGIAKENIISIMQDADLNFVLTYYAD